MGVIEGDRWNPEGGTVASDAPADLVRVGIFDDVGTLVLERDE